MKKLALVVGAAALLVGSQVSAAVLAVSGTFESYRAVGVGVPLTGVTDNISTWPIQDADALTAGLQPLTFSISGTVTTDSGGNVTSATLNQTSNLVLDYAGAAGTDRGTFAGITWSYNSTTAATVIRLLGGSAVGSCSTIIGSAGTTCTSALAAIQASDFDSAWNWAGVAPNFPVSDLFGGSAIFNLDVGGATGHDGATWTVGGESIGSTITAAVSQDIPGQGGTNASFNTAYAGVFNLQVVPVPAAVWLFGSAIGLLGFVRRRLSAA